MGDVQGPIAPSAISYGRRLGHLARERPGEIAYVFVESGGSERAFTWRQLEEASNRTARLLADRGVEEGDWLVVGLPNCPEHTISTLAGWKLGACVLPLSSKLPPDERDGLIQLADPTVVVSDWDLPGRACVGPEDLEGVGEYEGGPLPDRISHPGKAVGSGGSTGRPKIIIDPRPWAAQPGDTFSGLGGTVGMAPGQNVLIPGPLYHNAPYCWSHWSLFEGLKLVLMERFDAGVALQLIARHKIGWMQIVPTMMVRMLKETAFETTDLSSLEGFMHTAAPCPPWVKRAWIDRVGGEKVFEAFGATEAIGATIIRGDEWLEHEGSVGRPIGCEIQILGEDQAPLPSGEIGEIYARPDGGEPPAYEYRGAPPAATTSDGFVTVGDLGWMDEDGWVFLADRRADLIITGGANVYPQEVEAVLSEHPAVADVAVIGLPDDEWGKRVHAILLLHESGDPSSEELAAFCRERLVSYKVPRSFERIAGFPRDEAGKIRRSALIADRDGHA